MTPDFATCGIVLPTLSVLSESGTMSCIDILNDMHQDLEWYRPDSCLYNEPKRKKKRCDIFIPLPNIDALLVELKGNDVKEAFNQIEATIILLQNHIGQKRYYGLIVHGENPKIKGNRLLRLMEIFEEKYKGSLNVMKTVPKESIRRKIYNLTDLTQ